MALQDDRESHRLNQEGTPPSRDPQDLPNWVQRQDLAEADLPYIHSLLAASYADWQEQAEGFPWPTGRPIVLLHLDGSRVAPAADSPEDNGMSPWDWSPEALGPTAASIAFGTCRPTLTRADEHAAPSLKAFDSMAVPIFTRTTGIICAAFACLLPAGAAQAGELKLLQSAALHFRTCLYRRFELLFVKDLMRATQLTNREERRRDLLFEVMRRMNDHIDVENVLAEVFDILEQAYPLCRTDLFLSQDYSSSNEKVKPLAFHQQEMDICWKSFMEGAMREEREGGRRRIALPLAGKQGVYGVLLLDVLETDFDDSDLRFVTMLTSGAGTAFEKAKLHEQSNTLIGELRLINELTQRLNSSLRLADTMQFANAELLHIFKADHCFILQLDPLNGHFIIMSTNAPEMNNETFDQDYGFCGVMLSTKEPIILSDYHSATPVASYLMDVTHSRSLLASPLLLNGDVIGAVMVTHGLPNHFSYDNYKLLQVLSAHLGLALSNSTLHAEVRRMVITDQLTGLYVRHYLNERIQRKLQKDAHGSLILVDIDYFKKINDTYGHQIGDAILIQVCNIIRSSIRDSDIAARWGGEELAIYLPKLTLEQAMRVAERIRNRVEEETSPNVTVSCGLSEWMSTDEKISVESLFYRADMALYEAKNGGRNNVAVG
ncbi:sensor domain-containing diguanylate cyclase [Cohnella zeiphila]|uniref:Sensor domain-containing diguanylate cyclase n=1 Tax=Cohnella zeiphila TaxID=2761120 RepID=A0A7X0SPF2_9BACL|nr:sensor domain-containing diguanylate cyclase [Cohnella zeiphila]MBB6733745.1 sensor domain-containing diguanylate cyclase [Cohnella zeiphila]